MQVWVRGFRSLLRCHSENCYGPCMKEKPFKFSERSEAKARSRDEDLQRLESGKVSASDLRRENAFVKGGGFAGRKIGFSKKHPPENGDRWYSPDGRVCRADGSIERLNKKSEE